MRIATKAIHVGQNPDPSTGATIPPIYATSTFTQAAPGEHKGYAYARGTNPTRDGLQAALAAVEGGAGAVSFASGVAATTAVIQGLMRPGDSLVAYSDMYGGTFRLLERVMKPWGLEVRYTDSTDPAAIAGLIDSTTKLVWIETPTNPLLRLLDISAIGSASRAAAAQAVTKTMSRKGGSPMDHDLGLLLAVDNTFATPVLQRPLELGADLVVHSTTKYIGGHSDVIGGCVIAKSADMLAPLKFYANSAGGVPGPFDAFLTHRGLKTLPLRMQRHCENALSIARWASEHRAFASVVYPGLPSHPDHALAKRQMSGFGGIVTCILKGGLDAARKLMTSTKVFSCAESLGGVESLINHPAIMTHASMPREVRERIGVVDGLVRLSVGIEDVEDLIEDLDAALK